MKHIVSISSEKKGLYDAKLYALLKKTVKTVLRAEGVEVPCEVNILLTDDAGIHAVNREMRDVDRPTDVLSFPMFDLQPGEHPTEDDFDPGCDSAPLGDMCLSLERAKAQAEEFGHSYEREVCYLCVHSVLHLLGYDHLDEGPQKKQMRGREEDIMKLLDMQR